MAAAINWDRFGIGKRFRNAELTNVDRLVFAAVFKYESNASEFLKQGRGLLLSGPHGIGKTYAMAALLKHFYEQRGSRFDFMFVTAPDLFDRVAGREKDTFRQKSWLDVYASVPALLINDLGKEDRSREWKAAESATRLGRVLRRRHENELPVFITTNLPLVAPEHNQELPTFADIYGPSIWSLIYDLTQFRVQITAKDRRRAAATRSKLRLL